MTYHNYANGVWLVISSYKSIKKGEDFHLEEGTLQERVGKSFQDLKVLRYRGDFHSRKVKSMSGIFILKKGLLTYYRD